MPERSARKKKSPWGKGHRDMASLINLNRKGPPSNRADDPELPGAGPFGRECVSMRSPGVVRGGQCGTGSPLPPYRTGKD